MKTFSSADRSEKINSLRDNDEVFDLFIIGGGITGAGVARDAASRGLKVLLVEKSDYAFGTSSRSTKLIHGGLRYLENFEFKLVFEALSERQTLFDIAPHLVHPLRFLLPIYDDSRVGMFKMGCGMWLYDLLAGFRGGSHERLNKNEVIEQVPYLKGDGLKGAYIYSDAYMDDDRMVLETLRSANDLGATCLNYVSAADPIEENGHVVAMNCRDELSGETFKVKARHFISTVGPWTDKLGHKIFSDWKDLLKPSKGIHLTLPRERFPLASAVVLSDDAQGRIVFAIPREDMVIVGTTDTPYQDEPENVKAENEDVHYLNKILNQYFPKGEFSISDYYSSYAGIRPLVKSDEESVGKTSREHTVMTDPRGVTFVAGGKYTTYRKMAEEIVDHVLSFIPLANMGQLRPSNTCCPINPSCSQDAMARSLHALPEWSAHLNVAEEEMKFLWRRYGEESYDIRSRSEKYWAAEADFAIENTMCMNLLDFYVRRTPLFLSDSGHGESTFSEVSEVFKERMGWNSEEVDAQIKSVRDHIARELSWKS